MRTELNLVAAARGGRKNKQSEFASLGREKQRLEYLDWRDDLMCRHIVSRQSELVPQIPSQEGERWIKNPKYGLYRCDKCNTTFEIASSNGHLEAHFYDWRSLGQEEKTCPRCEGTSGDYRLFN